jgi:hypothetical protein
MTVGWRPYALAAMLAAGTGLVSCDRHGYRHVLRFAGHRPHDPGHVLRVEIEGLVGEEQENPEYAIFVDEATTDERRESFKHRRNAKQPETVRGLGDGAYFYIKGTAQVPFLDLVVGERVMTVGVSGNDLHPVSSDEAKRLERAAAELIVNRLKRGGGSS